MERALIFDLDGTLLDSLEDLADAGNAGLKAFGYPQHPISSYKSFVGDGIETLMRRALPSDADLEPTAMKDLVDHVRNVYGKAWNVKSHPYNGISELLTALGGRGNLRLGVLSNKPHPWTMEIVRFYFPQIPFADIRGAKPGVPLKPDPTAALDMAAGLGFMPETCFFVGDSNVDMRTAANAGMISIGVTWGFRGEAELREAGARHLVHAPDEIADLV